ncbi:MAG: MarC family protein [Egibacteraceae bacterium]
MDLSLAVETVVTLSVIMDPIGNVPLFLALTANQSREEQRRSAFHASAVAAGLIVTFALVGRELLGVLGIGLPALQVAGGLLLALIALDLLRPEDEAAPRQQAGRNVALVPLGTPLLAGPGAIAATMVSIERADGLVGDLSVMVALGIALAIVYLVLRYAGLLGRLLRRNAIDLITRVMGLLTAAIAVQLIAAGVQEWVRVGV